MQEFQRLKDLKLKVFFLIERKYGVVLALSNLANCTLYGRNRHRVFWVILKMQAVFRKKKLLEIYALVM